MNQARLLIPVILLKVILFSGCATIQNKSLDTSDLQAITGKTVVCTNREYPQFFIFTPAMGATAGLTGGIGGAVVGGAAAAYTEDDKRIQAAGVLNPVDSVREELLEGLTRKLNLQVTESAVSMTELVKTEDLVEQFEGEADLLFDVLTTGWSAVYFPFNWKRYRIIYGIRIRLLDLVEGNILSEGFYVYQTPKDFEPLPAKKDLVEGECEGMKLQMEEVTKAALAHFKKEILPLNSIPVPQVKSSQ